MNAMRILTPEIQRLRDKDDAKMDQEIFFFLMYKEKKTILHLVACQY